MISDASSASSAADAPTSAGNWNRLSSVYFSSANSASMDASADTFSNVYSVTAPTDTPSTLTSLTLYPASGVIANVWFSPSVTVTSPLGLMLPCSPADAVMVYSCAITSTSLTSNLSICGASSAPPLMIHSTRPAVGISSVNTACFVPSAVLEAPALTLPAVIFPTGSLV